MQAFLDAKGTGKKLPSRTDPTKPFTDASLEEAIAFCNWLTEEDGLDPLYERKEDDSGWTLDLRKPGYRLPFDYEWEYAARFGYDFFQKSGVSNWNAMRDELNKQVEDQALPKDINNGVVNYYRAAVRIPEKGHEYPLGMYDLCGNAPEICMTTEEQIGELKDGVEVGFIQMRGGKFISDIEAVAPWLSDGESNGVHISDEEKDSGEYGFRVIRTVPVYLFE